MATVDQVKTYYVRRNSTRGLQELIWADFVAQIDLDARNELIAAIRGLKRQEILRVILNAARAAVVKNLEAEADNLLADGQLSLEELDAFL